MAERTDREVVKDFIESVNRTPEEIIAFFGVKVKENKEEQSDKRFDIYRADGKLLLKNRYSWDFSHILKDMAMKFADEVSKSS